MTYSAPEPIPPTHRAHRGRASVAHALALAIATAMITGCAASTAHAQPADTWQATDGWYTLHHDVMRTGRSASGPGAPFKRVWFRKFWDQIISPEIEPIAAEGLVFLGTWGGEFHAMDAYTGTERWTETVAGGIRHSPCYDPVNKTVIFATLGDRTGAKIACRIAATGETAWTVNTPRGGFLTSPAVYRGRVYIGSRNGVLYCLDAKSGREQWTWRTPTGAMFMQSVAIRDNRLIVAAEDMIPRCFDAATGDLLWEGEKMEGDSVRFYYPVFWKDTVIFRTCAPDSEINRYQHVVVASAGEDGKKHQEIFKAHAWKDPFWEWKRNRWKLYTPEKYEAEQSNIREAIRSGRLQKTFYWLNVVDGSQRDLTSIGYSGSENGYSTPTPPCVDDNGNLYVLFKSLYTQYEYPIRAFDCIGTLNYETGLPEMLPKDPPGDRSLFPITADEVNMFTWAGHKLYNSHDHNFAYWDRDTKKITAGYAPKSRAETWAGVYLTTQQGRLDPGVAGFELITPTASLLINTEWNGTSRGSLAVHGDHVWWATGSMLVCLKGVTE